MGVIRNNINIEGITPEEELTQKNNGHTIIYSDTETIFIPDNKPGIGSIYEITINIELCSQKIIHTPMGKMLILDGIKTYKVICTEDSETGKVSMLQLEMPFNTFTELPANINYPEVKIYVIDSYFSLLDIRKIYGHFIYFLEISYEKEVQRNALHTKPDLNEASSKQLDADPINNIFEEISISEDQEKKKFHEPLIDLEEEIL